jgi:UDP-glucose 4-epimerase
MRVLVTGAAGYIGSVVAEQLVEQGHAVLCTDNLRHGHLAAIHPGARFAQGDILDGAWLRSLLAANPVDAVVHLAAEALVDESIRNPGLFYQVNVCGGLNLLDAMLAAGVTRIVFSSTAAVYGEPERVPLVEDARCLPVNPYGESKLTFEKALQWYGRAYGLRHVSLRYFNACGATARYGENHLPETHLIPILLEVALGQRESIRLYGTDYETPDGTCIRDYIHVIDIAQAHILALGRLDDLSGKVYNMGNQAGYSNREVIDMVGRVTGLVIPSVPASRRPGDPARLVASSQRIREELGWQPCYPDLQTMVETAWAWRREHPMGYAS